jgi:monovalent cation/proton antiporter MnhG/PhaG subunit
MPFDLDILTISTTLGFRRAQRRVHSGAGAAHPGTEPSRSRRRAGHDGVPGDRLHRVYTLVTRQSVLLDAATTLALIAFLGTVAFARYVQQASHKNRTLSMRTHVTVILTLAGAFFMLVAAIGVLRMPDLLMRMHAATKAGTLGAGLLLVAVAVHFGTTGVTIRAVATIFFPAVHRAGGRARHRPRRVLQRLARAVAARCIDELHEADEPSEIPEAEAAMLDRRPPPASPRRRAPWVRRRPPTRSRLAAHPGSRRNPSGTRRTHSRHRSGRRRS